jgi:asparagine synthase (glutamine-hydrolysing)
MKDKLPPRVLSRSKQGFDIPTHHWFRTVLKPLLLETVTKANVESMELLQWPAVNQMMQDHLERRANHGYQLWGLLALVLWSQRILKPAEVQKLNFIAN